MTADPRRTLGADRRRFTVDAEDRMRLEVLAARTGGIVETAPTPQGFTVRHVAVSGRTTEVTADTVPDAVRRLAAEIGEDRP